MGTGYLTLQITTGGGAIPVDHAHVVIQTDSGQIIADTYSDANGNTDTYSLEAPDVVHTLDPYYGKPAYSTCDVDVTAPGFISVHIHDTEIVDTQVCILPVNMEPLAEEPDTVTDIDIDIPPVALLVPGPRNQENPRSGTLSEVFIPDYITVHLGTPTNASARNVRVKFSDYIKNVTSSEIYSTWPYNSIVANIHAIVTFAINRIFTEWYPSRGFNFDITNSTAYDMFYRDGGPVFENISRIVDDIFNVYAHRIGFRNPFFTSFCNGTTATCNGLSQWGTVTLANQGKTPLEILRYYYPNDLTLAATNNVSGITESYPGYALTLGSQGASVLRMQNFLNRIRANFPLIPRISNPNGVFGSDTRDAVRTFQNTFHLTPDGIIGRATWNSITFTYVGVTRLAELDSEGDRAGIGEYPPTVVLQQGARGEAVIELQFLLNIISSFYHDVPSVIKDGVFDTVTKNAVVEFQRSFGLTPDGIVGPATWNKLYSVYKGIQGNAPVPPSEPAPPTKTPPYPGAPLRSGSTGADVRTMQTFLNVIRTVYSSIPSLVVDGVFGPKTQAAVLAFQREFVLAQDGIIGPVTWNKIVQVYQEVIGYAPVTLTYPGVPLRLGSRGSDVRLMQGFLSELRVAFPGLPAVAVDGIFGPQTQAAVIAFQRMFGLSPDGIIGPLTWYEIINRRNAAV